MSRVLWRSKFILCLFGRVFVFFLEQIGVFTDLCLDLVPCVSSKLCVKTKSLGIPEQSQTSAQFVWNK